MDDKYKYYFEEIKKVDAEQQQWRNETNNDYYEFNYEFYIRDYGFSMYKNKCDDYCLEGITIRYGSAIGSGTENELNKYLSNMKKEIRRLKTYGIIDFEDYIPKLKKAKQLERRLKAKNIKQKVNKI